MDLSNLGKNSLSRLTASLVEEVATDDVIPTGIPGLDQLLAGGLYSGTITELFGYESTGKTTTILSIVRNIQQKGKVVAILDDEFSISSDYALKIGIDPDSLIIANPMCGEDMITISEQLMSGGLVDVLVIDSLAGIISKQESIRSMGYNNPMLQQNIISQLLERLRQLTIQYGVPVIVTNQLRSTFKDGKFTIRTIASTLIRRFANVRLYISKVATLTCHVDEVGMKISFRKVKGPMNLKTKAEAILFYGTGISNASSLLLLENSPIQLNGSWYMFDGLKIGQGVFQSIKTLDANPKLYERIMGEVK